MAKAQVGTLAICWDLRRIIRIQQVGKQVRQRFEHSALNGTGVPYVHSVQMLKWVSDTGTNEVVGVGGVGGSVICYLFLR